MGFPRHPSRWQSRQQLPGPIRANKINLGFERTKSTSDSKRLLSLVKIELEHTLHDDPGRTELLGVVARVYYERFADSNVLEDSEESIRFYHECLVHMPGDPVAEAAKLRGIADLHRQRYESTESLADIEHCLEFTQRALDNVPDGYADWPFHLRSLADAYVMEKTGKVSYLNKVIRLYGTILEKVAEDSTRQLFLHLSLSIAYAHRFARRKARDDLEQAIRYSHLLVSNRASPGGYRMFGGLRLIEMYAGDGDWACAYETALDTLSLLPVFTPRYLQASDRQILFMQIPQLRPDAAALALMAGKGLAEAIRLLELGRGLIAEFHHSMPTDISALSRQHPGIAEEYIGLRDQLEFEADDGLSTVRPVKRDRSQRYDISQELEAKNFRYTDVAGNRGPIVFINASDYRCDALIVERSGPRLLPLPRLNMVDIQSHQAGQLKPELDMQVLEWLWDTVAGPLLEELGPSRGPSADDDGWPRMWWIPTGPLVKFPIHAAGHHTDGSDTVLDRVASSYSTSAKALLQSLQSSQDESEKYSTDLKKVVLVGMGNTPGLDVLPFVTREVDGLDCLCRSMSFEVAGRRAHVLDMLSALMSCYIFHFAGHGCVHASDPSQSALLLCDGGLTVAELWKTNLHLHRPFLAYLILLDNRYLAVLTSKAAADASQDHNAMGRYINIYLQVLQP